MRVLLSSSLFRLDAASDAGADEENKGNPDHGVPEPVQGNVAAVAVVVRVTVVTAPNRVIIVTTHL